VRRPLRGQGGIAYPLLLGQPEEIEATAREPHIPLTGIEVFDHLESPFFEEFSRRLFQVRQRKG
jgi:phosphotransacetylase